MRCLIRASLGLLLAGCIDLPTDVVDRGAPDGGALDAAGADGLDARDRDPPDLPAGECTPWAALEVLGGAARVGQPTVVDVDGDGYRDLLVPGEAGGDGEVRAAFGGRCGLGRVERWATAGRPWRATVGRFDGVTRVLVTLEQDPGARWSVRGYPLDDPGDVWSWQIPAQPLGDESFIAERPLLLLAAPLDGAAGDELLFGSFYYLFSSLGPRQGTPRAIEPAGESPIYAAQDLVPLADGRIFMLEANQWRIFAWDAALERLDGGEIGRPEGGSDTYRALASDLQPGGARLAAGFALDGRLFDVLLEADGAVRATGYRYPQAEPGTVHGLAIGDLRARGALDVVALVHPDAGNPATDEAVLTACAEATAGACSGWYDQRVRGPYPLLISADFDSPIGQPTAHELLLHREGEARFDCWRFDQVDLIDGLRRCD